MNKLGVLIVLGHETDINEEMRKAREIGCECCQLSVWDPALYTDEKAEEIARAARENGIEISTLCAGWSGPRSGISRAVLSRLELFPKHTV